MIEECRLNIEYLRFASGGSVIKKMIKTKERSYSALRQSSFVKGEPYAKKRF